MIPKKVVSFGEVMMRLSSPSYKKLEQSQSLDICFGGSEMNVSASLKRLGIDASHVTVFPDNTLGLMAKNYLYNLQLDTTHIKMAGSRIGLYFIEKGASMRASEIVYDRDFSAFQNLNPKWFDWEKILKRAGWFHWSGITASLSQNAAQCCLDAVKTAQKLGIRVSSDIYYRSGQWNYGKKPQDILPTLAEYSNILLANADNMKELLGISVSDNTENDFVEASQQTLKQYPNIKKVINTHRKQISSHHNSISAMAFDGNHLSESIEMDIPFIVDRVGGGDAFLAGFIYGQLMDFDDQKSINYGIAASAFKHTIEGDINLATKKDIELLLSGDTTGRLRR